LPAAKIAIVFVICIKRLGDNSFWKIKRKNTIFVYHQKYNKMILSLLLNVTDILNKTKVDTAAVHKLTFFELLVKGGPILIPIGILSICAIYIMAEKYFIIDKHSRINTITRNNFKQALDQNDSEKALTALKSVPGAYSRIFSHAVNHSHFSVPEIEKEMEALSNIEVSKMSKGLSYLGLIAGIAPMLGFIGTISGIIKIFYNISVTDNISIGIIAGGLYEKMISSGTGLIVGVIAYSGYHLLNMKVDKFVSLVESDAFVVLNSFKKRQYSATHEN
jgi:biopolymer transport protein ExbB